MTRIHTLPRLSRYEADRLAMIMRDGPAGMGPGLRAFPEGRANRSPLRDDKPERTGWDVSLTAREITMRTVGHRKQRPISFSASADLLLEGARFNDEIHRLTPNYCACVPKGIYRFKSHEEANQFDRECLLNAMVRTAREWT
jgi:hypothetical protein